MKVTMVSHASVLIEEGSIGILTDPWFTGEVFNESWSLLCKPAFTSAISRSVTHIWISHEHPDHLHFPTLRTMPEEQRSHLTLLYQEHFSPRVFQALTSLGYRKVEELPLGRWQTLSGGVSVLCYSLGTIDSVLAVRSGNATILNVNDCIITPTVGRDIAKRIGPVDVLLVQFSFANWVGNPGDIDVTAADKIIDRMRLCISTFEPRVTIPFASFVYFSHTENRHMNAWINTPDRICDQLSDSGTQLQFLYNGDSWSSRDGCRVDGDPLQRYRGDYQEIANLPYRSHPSYPISELLDLGRQRIDEVRSSFPRVLLRWATPIDFYVTDLGIAIRFDLCHDKIEAHQCAETSCDFAVGSQALWFALKFPWGFSTLEISGRYRLLKPQVNRLAMYLCHLHSSDIHCKHLGRRLMESRVWRFCWSKRQEVIARLLARVAQPG